MNKSYLQNLGIIKGIDDEFKENEWSEFLDEYKKRNEEKKFTKKLKLLFNINSDFMVMHFQYFIWLFFICFFLNMFF